MSRAIDGRDRTCSMSPDLRAAFFRSLRAEANRLEQDGDVGGWMMAMRRLHFHASGWDDQRLTRVVVSDDFHKLLEAKAAKANEILGSDVDASAGQLLFNGIPIHKEEPCRPILTH